MKNQTPILLNRANLAKMPADFKRPSYNVENVRTGIVHIGVGGFHRAHEAMYVDRLMAKTGDLSWGICGVGLRENDRAMKKVLDEQDNLYTLIEKYKDGTRKASVIGAMTGFLMAQDNPQAVIDKMAEPEVRIVSLTITEGGYNFDASTGEFIAANPEVIHDIENPRSPKLVFGYLVAALKKRKENQIKPFTVMSCDNIQHNGQVLKKMLLSFIELFDTALADWVNENVSFPNSMVDRITPATTEEDITTLKSKGVEDGWPVVCEPFEQWVIEDNFCNEKPELNLVGAQFVDDVAPYEKLKLRMLNAGHSVLGLIGSVAGLDTIHESVDVMQLKRLLSVFMEKEVMPTLDMVEGIDVFEYRDTLISRFSNPFIKDTLARICRESSAKLPVFLLPTVRDNLASGRNVSISALVIACWAYYSDKHSSQDGKPLEVNDVLAETLHVAAVNNHLDSLSFLKLEAVFGSLVNQNQFTVCYKAFVERLYQGEPVLLICEEVANNVLELAKAC